MKIKDEKTKKRLKIRKRIRSRVSGTLDKPRLSVYKSNTCMYVQLIDDVENKTLVSSSLRKLKIKQNNIAGALELGKFIADQAMAKGIKSVVFDRSGYLYHGRIKALAEGARERGLKF